MTKTEIKPLYAEACARARCKPSESELAVWYSQLGHGDIRDLREAINRHFEKSTWMPRESELKPLMEFARRDRTAGQVMTEQYQQQRCPKCGSIVGMMRPAGDQFRTWCVGCQSYRKIIPEDLQLDSGRWQMICAELDIIYQQWVKRGEKPYECVDPRVDRNTVGIVQ